jgi:hypothetical protein
MSRPRGHPRAPHPRQHRRGSDRARARASRAADACCPTMPRKPRPALWHTRSRQRRAGVAAGSRWPRELAAVTGSHRSSCSSPTSEAPSPSARSASIRASSASCGLPSRRALSTVSKPSGRPDSGSPLHRASAACSRGLAAAGCSASSDRPSSSACSNLQRSTSSIAA